MQNPNALSSFQPVLQYLVHSCLKYTILSVIVFSLSHISLFLTIRNNWCIVSYAKTSRCISEELSSENSEALYCPPAEIKAWVRKKIETTRQRRRDHGTGRGQGTGRVKKTTPQQSAVPPPFFTREQTALPSITFEREDATHTHALWKIRRRR